MSVTKVNLHQFMAKKIQLNTLTCLGNIKKKGALINFFLPFLQEMRLYYIYTFCNMIFLQLIALHEALYFYYVDY